MNRQKKEPDVEVKAGLKKIGFWLGVLLVTGFLVITLFIGLEINQVSRMARERYQTGTITALMNMAQDDRCLLELRDKAIWALGQLAPKKALPVLKSLQTGEPCDHTQKICQYELKKAIRYCRGGPSLFHPLWNTLFIKNQGDPI